VGAPTARAVARTDGPLFPDILRSEWTKLRSVRSTFWSLLVAAAVTIGVSALICSIYVNRYDHMSLSDRLNFNPTAFTLNGLLFSQLAIAVLGVLIITSEFSTGMIRSTFAAVPQRSRVMAAKATVFGAVTLVVGLASCAAAFFVGQTILASKHLEAHLGDPGVLRSVTGAALYLAVLGLLALGIGGLIRHSAGAIAAVFGVLFVLPGLVSALPASWDRTISPYLPMNAGSALFRGGRGGMNLLSPWLGFGVFCAYTAVALAAAAVSISRRDP
jgi:hypothetical protein